MGNEQQPTPDETQATQQTQPKGIDPKTGEPYEAVKIPVPKRSTFDRLLQRAESRGITIERERTPRVGDRVALGGGITGEIIETEVLGEQPPPSDTPALAAAAHTPGARVYVVRYEMSGQLVQAELDAGQFTLAD